MSDLLERFKENELQNKDDLLYSLGSMYDNFDSDASAPELRKEMLKKFIKHIESTQLPRCDDWWFYSYDFTRFGIMLDMCHCAEFAVESDDEFTMTIDEAFTVTEVTCDMMTVAEGELGDAVTVSVSEGDYLDRAIARLKKYGVPKGDDMLGWFGKLIVSEQISDRLGTAKEAEHEHP